MFSGIVDRIGTVSEVRPSAAGCLLRVDAAGYWNDVPAGASIAIDGVCLTLSRKSGSIADFDVIAETLRRTALGGLRTGDLLNLQKSLAVGDRIDGHFVQGHVDAVGTIIKAEDAKRDVIRWILIGAEVAPLVAPKGSITIDGISLTIAAVDNDRFSVALIPTTLERTTLGRKPVGAKVNLETDIIARMVAHYLRSTSQAPAAAPPKTAGAI